jgi:hypothetical protein
MQLKVRTVAVLAASCAIAATSASAALAAGTPIATTQPATSVTSTSAVLEGAITANGSTTAWQFEYGPSVSTLRLAPVEAGSVAPTGAPVPVSARVVGLTPSTTYSFTLLASNASNVGYYPYPGLFITGATLTFTTKNAPGKVTLASTKLKVRKGSISVPLKCLSSPNCKGKLELTGTGKLSRHGRSKTFACVKAKSFSVGAGKLGTIKARLTSKCLRALRFAKHHKLKGALQVTFSTGQPKLDKGVTLSP